MSRRPLPLARAAVAGALVSSAVLASPLGCNVFRTIDRCTTDRDCSSGLTCDPEAKLCVRGDAGSDAPFDGGGDVRDADAAPDTWTPPDISCASDAAFYSVKLIPGLEDASLTGARFSADESRVFYSAFAAPGESCDGSNLELCSELYYAERSAGVYIAKGQVGGVNQPDVADYLPTLSPDERLLLFESSRSRDLVGGKYVTDRSRIWSSSQSGTTAVPFTPPINQGTFGQTDPSWSEGAPYLLPRPSEDAGTKVYFMSNGRIPNAGSFDLFVTELNAFGAPLPSGIINIVEVNSSGFDGWPVIANDDQTLYFAREYPAARHIFVSRRVNGALAGFGAPEPLGLGDDDQFPSWISPNNCRLYFVSNRPDAPPGPPGKLRLWVAERRPL